MHGKYKILIIIIFVLGLIGVWGYAIYYFLGGTKPIDNSASIINNPINNSQIGNSNTGQNLTSSINETLTGSLEHQNTNLSGNITKNPTTNVVYLHMPDYFINFNFEKFLEKYKQQNNVDLIVKSYTSLEDYKRFLNTYLSGGNNIDIFLIPTNYIQDFEKNSYKLQFGQNNVSGLFHRLFSDLIGNQDYTFIPYAIDPFVTISKESFFDNGIVTVSSIKEKLLTSGQSNGFTIKFLFGISLKDIILLKAGRETFEDYFLILYNLLFQSSLTSNSNIIQTFIDLSNPNTFDEWSSTKMNKILGIHGKKNPQCTTFKKICMLSYGSTDGLFGSLSDLDIMQKHFNNGKISINDLDINNFIYESNSYMVRGWGFLINKDSPQIVNSIKFINNYIQEGVDGNILLWGNVLSPFNNILEQQKYNNKYKNIINYSPNFYLLETSSNLQKDFLGKTKLYDVFKGNYNLQLFISNLIYTRSF